MARINWFEVFTACTDILEKISAIHCKDPRDLTAVHVHKNRDSAFCCGVNIVESLLTMADELERHDFLVNASAGVSVTRTAIRETFERKMVSAKENAHANVSNRQENGRILVELVRLIVKEM